MATETSRCACDEDEPTPDHVPELHTIAGETFLICRCGFISTAKQPHARQTEYRTHVYAARRRAAGSVITESS